MPAPASDSPRSLTALPAVPILAVGARQAALLSPDGEIDLMSHDRAQLAIHNRAVMVCHAPFTRQRLGVRDLLAFDILELFAFVLPARFAVPTPGGVAKALGLSAPKTLEDMPFTILEAAQALLADLGRESRGAGKSDPVAVAQVMGLQGKGWNWTPHVLAACGETYDPLQTLASRAALNVWQYLPEWAEEAPPPAPAHYPVTGEESRQRLARMLGPSAPGREVEARPQQVDYATALTAAFAPAVEEEAPHLVLAEAGTGVGKTAGYLAPASVWAEKNGGAVWVSTYTKNLQRQIGQELDRLYPDPEVKARRAAVRKGRENYLCLLNFEETAAGAGLTRQVGQAIAAGLMARWAEATADGDLHGGDFPGWLPGLLGYVNTRGLALRRGECIYAACDHYHRCFIERSARKARHADIVVANHALVMTHAALAGPETQMPERYVFDEGHHLFDAADSAFAAHLTVRQTAELRRWILGPEGGRRGRARGLKKRIEDLVAVDPVAETELQAILHAAPLLPGFDWAVRLKDERPQGAAEEFFTLVARQVRARSDGGDGPFSIETSLWPLLDGLGPAARKLAARLKDLRAPLRALSRRFRETLAAQADTLDSDSRKRIEAICAGLDRRAEQTLGAWLAMLAALDQPPALSVVGEGAAAASPAQFVDWLEIEREAGQTADIGLYRHYVDPMQPFAAVMEKHAHGIAMTSATLRDRGAHADEDEWASARVRTGARHFTAAPTLFEAASPYDYAAQTRVFVVTDIAKDDIEQVAAAYRVLFTAAGGGGLGLFTAIQRLRAVRDRILQPLEDGGITLYAQHADAMDTGTLVDIFREDTHACMLGTDAVRDGIDVPGESLRLLIYDRVPWPRPTILHKARRDAFGGKAFDDLTTRLRLRQAYGRLIRRASDRGVFVMLDRSLPSRLCSAFPDTVKIERLGLAEAAQQIRGFLK